MELIDHLREAFERRHLEAFLELLDPDVCWVGIPEPGLEVPECRNRDEVRDVLEGYLSEGKGAHPEVVAAAGDRVVVDVRPDPPVEGLELHHVYRLRDGRIVRMEDYPTREAALEASGAA